MDSNANVLMGLVVQTAGMISANLIRVTTTAHVLEHQIVSDVDVQLVLQVLIAPRISMSVRAHLVSMVLSVMTLKAGSFVSVNQGIQVIYVRQTLTSVSTIHVSLVTVQTE